MKFIIETDDPAIAAELLKVASGGKTKETKSAKSEAPLVVPAEPAAATAVLPVVSQPTPTAPAASAPPVVAPVPVAADEVTAEDKAALDAGWTVDHIKDATTKYVQKLGSNGPAGLKAILAEYGAERVANGPKSLAPRHYPAVHGRLVEDAA